MAHRMMRYVALMALLVSLGGTAQARPTAPPTDQHALVYVALSDPGDLNRFRATGLPAYALLHGREATRFLLAGAGPTGLEALSAAGLSFRVLDPDMAGATYYLAYPQPTRMPPDWPAYGRVLLDEGLQVLLRMSAASAARLAQAGVEVVPLSPEPITLPQDLPREIRPSTIQPDPIVQAMMDQVFSSTVYQIDGDLSGEWPVPIGGEPYTITTRHTYSGEPLRMATQYSGEFLADRGLDVEYHVWQTITNPNVIGEIPGIIHPEDIYIISAHLDDTSETPYTLAPGADDNASGSAAVLIAADILSQYNWACTLRFALFTGEEQGLLGSKAYAHRSRLIRENIVGVVNLDMIAWNTPLSSPDIDLHAKGDFTPTVEMAELFSDVVSVYNLNLVPEIWTAGSGGSDHSAFWIHGYPAFLGIEDFDDFNPYYHSTLDRLEQLDMAYFTDFVKASLGTLVHLSDCLITGGVGLADGHVTAADTGLPIAGATVTFEDTIGQRMPVTSDAGGYYTRTLPIGSYTATAWAYGYLPSLAGVTIVTDAVTTQDFTLTTAPEYVISGTVTEAGTGMPLYARVSAPGTPVVPTWTDPATGFYSLTIAAGTYTFHVTATAHHAADELVLVDGNRTQDFGLEPFSCILLVDDDQYSPDVLPYYTSALDALGLPYDLWDTNDGDPVLSQLQGHRMVLWFTSRLRTEVFTPANEEAVATYLDGGGRFFLSSVDYLYDAGLTDFGRDYLGINSFTGDQAHLDVVGNASSPIGSGLGPFYLTPPLGWRPPMRTDVVSGIQGSPFRWEGLGQDNSTSHVGSDFRTVFLAWPLEGLDNVDDRAAVLQRVVDWFGGCGPDGRLEGHVTDASNGNPLSGATVTVQPWGFQAATDPSGTYSLTLSAGTYDLIAERAGYLSQTATVTISPDLTTTLDFALQPTAPALIVSPGALSETLSQGTSLVAPLTLGNEGNAPLAFTLTESPPVGWLEASPLTGTVAPSASTVVSVTLDASGVGEGRYTSTLQVYSNDPDLPSVPVPVTLTVLLPCEAAHDPNFSWTPLTPTAGAVLTFTASASGTEPITFTWSFGDGLTGTGRTAGHSYTHSGTYTVTLTAANACGQAVATRVVTVRQAWRVHLPLVLRAAGP